MTLSSTVSAKIPKKLREKLEAQHVNVSAVVRQALQEEVDRREEEELRTNLDELNLSLRGRLTREDIVTAVRSSRDER
jgi:post-segregation antitoxin (ccd killing protein)